MENSETVRRREREDELEVIDITSSSSGGIFSLFPFGSYRTLVAVRGRFAMGLESGLDTVKLSLSSFVVVAALSSASG